MSLFECTRYRTTVLYKWTVSPNWQLLAPLMAKHSDANCAGALDEGVSSTPSSKQAASPSKPSNRPGTTATLPDDDALDLQINELRRKWQSGTLGTSQSNRAVTSAHSARKPSIVDGSSSTSSRLAQRRRPQSAHVDRRSLHMATNGLVPSLKSNVALSRLPGAAPGAPMSTRVAISHRHR